jgi:glyoxylase-like metal-dependent hydrolase (beta-lactamase superfamily II)
MTHGILQWRLGNVTVTTLNDGFNQAGLEVIQGLSQDEAVRIQRAAFRSDQPKITVNLFLIESEHHAPILVDTGMGFIGGETSGHLLAALRKIGVAPEEIRTILLTHLHPDHSAGLTDGQGRAIFPNAQLVMHKKELDFWTNNDNFKSSSDDEKSYVALIQASVAPYEGRIRLFVAEEEVAPGLRSVPLIGHTPGHSGYWLTSEGKTVLIWGDIVQFPEIQSLRPDTGLAFDVNREQAGETRKYIMNKAVDERLLVAGMHIDFPAFAFVQRLETGFRLVPALWVDYA